MTTALLLLLFVLPLLWLLEPLAVRSVFSRQLWSGLLHDIKGGVPYDLISRPAQARLTEFSDAFIAAYTAGEVDEWAREHGLYIASRAIKTTFPIPISAAGYHKFLGDIKYRSLFAKTLDMKPETWQDGVAELASVVEAPDFIGWASEPERIAAAGRRMPNKWVVTEIEANPTVFDGKAMFADDHPNNAVDATAGTFDNNITGAGTDLTGANIGLAKQKFRAIKGPNGDPLGLKMTHVMVPAALEERARDVLERDLIIEAGAGSTFGVVQNRHKGTVQIIVADELTNASQWYAMALSQPGMYPWVLQDGGVPEEIRHDKTDALYKNTLKVGVAYIMQGAAKLVMPHTMQRWAGTAP